MWSASSRGSAQTDGEGGQMVKCYECGEPICVSYAGINRALCALCDSALKGIQLPEHILLQMKMSRAGNNGVSLLVIREQEREKAKLPAKFSLRSMGSSFVTALGIPKVAKDQVPSKVAADEKVRRRLFSNVVLGSIDDVNNQLKEKE